MQAYDIGISALRAQQTILTTTGQNIANSSTPGYHRQRVELATRRAYGPPDARIGSGVDVSQIRRIRDASLEQELLNLGSALSAAEVSSQIYSQIEQVLTPGTGAIQDRLSDFFNSLEDVANSPANAAARKAFVTAANNLGEAFHQVDSQWRDLQESVTQEASLAVDVVNTLANHLFEIEHQINIASSQGDVPNALYDQRDQTLTDLSRLIDVSVDTGSEDAVRVSVGNLGFFRSQVVELQLQGSAGQGLSVVSKPNGESVEVSGGKLFALLDQVNQRIPQLREKFQELAEGLIGEINRLHQVGLPANGGFSHLIAAESVTNPANPLSTQATTSGVQPGEFFVTVTDKATGDRTTHRIDVDPLLDSLEDITNRLDAIPGLAAFIDPQGRQIISAEPGYTFDFTGRVDVDPQVVSWSGTSVITVDGNYSGIETDEWTWQIIGSGQIGVTPGLELEVRNRSGQLVSRHNIGAGYEARTPLSIADGMTLSLSTGTVNNGDSQVSIVIADSDTARFLSSVGLNSLFLGRLREGLSVREDILLNPFLTSLSRNGVSGDAQIADKMLQLRTARISAGGTLTPVENLAGLTAEVGIEAANSQTELAFLQDQTNGVRAQQQAISGVNVDEELVTMIESQQAYQAAARYLSTISNVLDELMDLVR